jgi:3-deoxy-D-manno-octulosonic-acid transferase
VTERLPLTLRAYRRLAASAAPLAPFLLSRRLNRGKEHPARIGERRGHSEAARPPGPIVWVHGASVGEILAALQLIERVRADGFSVLVTSGTVTSALLAQQRFSAGVIHQFVPLDSPPFIARFLDHWRPSLALFVESDLWPNLILASAARKIPMIIVNGRVSERSYNRWRHLPGTIAALLERFDLCLAQSEPDGERFGNLGAPHVSVTGNLKLDMPAPPADPAKLSALKSALEGRLVFAAASTHPGEESVAIEAHRRLKSSFPNLLTILVPRHPDRGIGLVEIASGAGLTAVMRSRRALPDKGVDIYVADTLGELGIIYRLAPVVFVGGSLIAHGGQNPIEPAKLGAAVLHGPHVRNFAEIYSALDAAGGADEVTDAGRLAVRIGALFKDSTERKNMVAAAKVTVAALGGALDRTLGALEPYLLQLRLEQRQGDA